AQAGSKPERGCTCRRRACAACGNPVRSCFGGRTLLGHRNLGAKSGHQVAAASLRPRGSPKAPGGNPGFSDEPTLARGQTCLCELFFGARRERSCCRECHREPPRHADCELPGRIRTAEKSW